MKLNLILIVVIAVFWAVPVHAQRGMSLEDRMKNLDEELNLDDKQYSKIENILENQMKEFRKLRDESDGDREQMREKGRKMMKDTDDKILDLLDDGQKKKYRKLIEERRQNRDRRRSPN